MSQLLAGKIALITGAGQGIGKGIARQFLKEGASVVFCGRHKEKLLHAAQELCEESGITDETRTHCVEADVTDIASVQALTQNVLDRYGRIDILVNNAGMSKEILFVDMPIETFDEIMTTNMRSVMLVTKAVLPVMVKQQYGRIINIGSGAAVRGLPGSTAYSASKGAVVTFTQALGDEVRNKMKLRNIRINAICPGPVDTEMFRKSAVRQDILNAGGDVTSVDEMGQAAVYLASDLSGVMNSQVLVLRGFNRW